MPKIPRFERSRSLPGVSGNAPASLAVAGAPGQAVARAAETVGNLVADRAATLQKQDSVNQSILLKSQYDDDHRAFKGEEINKTGSDSFKNVERGKEFRDSMVKKYTGNIENPELKSAVSNYIMSRSNNMLDSLSTHQSNQRGAVSEQARSLTLDGFLKDAGDGEGLDDLRSRWADTIAGQMNLGLLSEEEATDAIMNGESALAEAHLNGLMNSDPTAAIEAINNDVYNDVLTQDQQEDFAKKAKALESAQEKDIENQAKERERLSKIALKESQNQTGNEFLQANLDGLLSRTDVMKSNLNPTGENGKKAWIKAIENREKKVAADAKKSDVDPWTTDPQVEANFQTKITLDPASVSEASIMAMQGNGLSTDDAKSLISYKNSRVAKKDDPQKTQDAKSAYVRLREAKRDDLFSGNEVDNSKEWAAAVSQLGQWIDNHPNDDPADYVDQLLEPAKDGVMRRMFDFLPGVDPFESEEQRQTELDEEAGIEPDAIIVTTQEEFNALPSGAIFTEDGVKYRKP